MPTLLLATRKEPSNYVQGVVLPDKLEALFRSVPPPLAMTGKHEKAERAQLMRERGCGELEAAYGVAERIAANEGVDRETPEARISERLARR